MSCFEGEVVLSAAILDALTVERNSGTKLSFDSEIFPGRKSAPEGSCYIRTGKRATDFDLLTDLVFFNEFDRNLAELIMYFVNACRLEDDPQKFFEIAQEFYFCTQQDQYNALYALREMFEDGSDKRKNIDFLIRKLVWSNA